VTEITLIGTPYSSYVRTAHPCCRGEPPNREIIDETLPLMRRDLSARESFVAALPAGWTCP
jgi:hypothetical protein